MVPGSTLRYGSSFCIETLSPRATSRLPRLEAVRPLPSEEATPPVTNRCLVSFARGPTGLQPIAVHQRTPIAARNAHVRLRLARSARLLPAHVATSGVVRRNEANRPPHPCSDAALCE